MFRMDVNERAIRMAKRIKSIKDVEKLEPVIHQGLSVPFVGKSLWLTAIPSGSTAATSVILQIGLGGDGMSRDEGKREIVYQMTMAVARQMLGQGLISKTEYRNFEKKMREKYTPVIGGLFANPDLL